MTERNKLSVGMMASALSLSTAAFSGTSRGATDVPFDPGSREALVTSEKLVQQGFEVSAANEHIAKLLELAAEKLAESLGRADYSKEHNKDHCKDSGSHDKCSHDKTHEKTHSNKMEVSEGAPSSVDPEDDQRFLDSFEMPHEVQSE